VAGLGNTLVVFGGADETFTPLADTWTWNGSAWTQSKATGPSARYGHSMATLGTHAVLFGGLDGAGGTLDDTWAWDGASWQKLDAPGPPARVWAALAGN
jgi:hypothetical protein